MKRRNSLSDIVAVSAALYFLVFANLAFIQLVQGAKYHSLAENNRIKKETVVAPRGRIYSSDGVLLAGSRPYYSVYCDLNSIDTDSRSLFMLSSIIKIPVESINTVIKIGKTYRENEFCLASNIDAEGVNYLEENSNLFNGVEIKTESKRYYPYSSLYAHSIGYVGSIAPGEIDKLRQSGYGVNDFVGKTGVENSYERLLKGRNGVKYYEVDVHGKVIKEIEAEKSIERRSGMDVYTRINHSLTAYVESIFSEYESGAVLVLDADDGGVITMYSKPSFDANMFIYGVKKDVWDILNRNTLSPFLNRTAAGLYPPGSVFKTVTALAALQNKDADWDTYFQECNGSILVSGKMYGCWSVHGEKTLYDALIQSCDVYFYQLGIKMGADKLSEYAQKSGFGEETGIDIAEESGGLLPDRKFFNRKYGKNGWGLGQIANMSIGQGDLLVTPLQLASFMLAVANRGKMMSPFIVDSIKDLGNEIFFRHKKSVKGYLPFSEDEIDVLCEALRDAVNTKEGTGVNAALKEGLVAGKTGTSENPHGEPHSLFMSYYPYGAPEIVAVVIVENGGHGSGAACEITKKIYKKCIEEGLCR